MTLAPPPLEALSGFAAGFLLIGLGFTLFLRGAPMVPAVGQTMLAQTETIFGPVWVWLLFGETPAATTLIGGAVILAAVVAMALAGAGPRRPAHRASAPPIRRPSPRGGRGRAGGSAGRRRARARPRR